MSDFYAAFTPKAERPTLTAVPDLDTDGLNRWAARALENELTTLSEAREGTRNDRLNTAAYNLGQIVAGGSLDEDTVRQQLEAVADRIGLPPSEAHNTITSGLSAGQEHPRYPKTTTDTTTPIQAFTVDTTDPEALHAAVHEALPRIDWQTLWDDDSDEEWIIEPLLPARRLIALYSPPKVGKSLLMLELAVACATGRPVLGATIDRPRRVLYVDFENDPRADIRERLTAMGHGPADLDNLILLSFPTLAGLDSERGAMQLMAAVEAYECEVVIIDTVSRSVDGDENENDTWLSFYRHTGLKLKRAGVAMMRLDHTGKDETRGQRGGSAKGGDVDAVWRMSRIDDNNYRLDCEMQRMPIAEKTLVLERKALPHLHHAVRPEGRAAAWQIRVDAIIDALDSMEAPDDFGRDRAKDALKVTGLPASNAAISAAVKRRRQRLEPVPEAWGQVGNDYLSPDDGDSSGQVEGK